MKVLPEPLLYQFKPVVIDKPVSIFTTVFHEPWWLDAVSPGQWNETTVMSSGEVMARLPYVTKRVVGITGIGMPPLTHVLGPQLPVSGRSSSFRTSDNRKLLTELMSQLPPHNYFVQTCDPGMENTLPLYAMGYDSAVSHTLRIDAGQPAAQTWQGMRKQIRYDIRRAEKMFVVDRSLGIEEFCRFFNACVKNNHNTWWSKAFERRADAVKIRLYEACRAHDAGCLLAARDEQGVLRAAVMPVWGHGMMYYLLTAHDGAPAGSGSVKLLLWEAVKMASAMGLGFDFDGFPRPNAVNVLTGFGGEVHNRIAITKVPPMVLFARAVASRSRFGF
jgi:hypothetical protein